MARGWGRGRRDSGGGGGGGWRRGRWVKGQETISGGSERDNVVAETGG